LTDEIELLKIALDNPNRYIIERFNRTHQPINKVRIKLNLVEMLMLADRKNVTVVEMVIILSRKLKKNPSH
jgi:hypothetical protein